VTWPLVLASLVLAVVAAAGVLRPFGRGRAESLERLADPLEDERLSLLRGLRDLDEEHSEGSLTDQDYRALRSETEERAVAVLRALEARDGAGELAAGLKEVRPSGLRNGDVPAPPSPARDLRRRLLITALATTIVVATVVALLFGGAHARTGDQPITGSAVGATPGDPLAFFEQRVKDHPNDVAARLDLASRELQIGNVQSAITQYLAALRLDPSNAEAHANLGLVLFQAGRPQEALQAENRALASDPKYAEAMYFKGVILLRGLNQPDQAREALRAYLAAAPFGAYREQAQALLRQAAG
jgi:tetratricopeptide (TPR) repeat protein